jgi:hypothetical protein
LAKFLLFYEPPVEPEHTRRSIVDKLQCLEKKFSFSNNKMPCHIRWGILLVFIFIGFSAFSEEIGRLTLEIRATEEEADNNGFYWYYVYFTNTLPENEFLTKVLAGWSTISTSGYFQRTANGFELKAKYKGNKDHLLNTWIDYDYTGGSGRGIFRYLPGVLRKFYNWEYHLETAPYDWIDYKWHNRNFFENNGYYQYYEEWSFTR